MNPRTPTGQPPQSTLLSARKPKIDWESFEAWLFKEYRRFTALDRLRYAKRYAHCLLNRDLGKLKMLNDSLREHVLKALSALSKFLGMHEEFLRLVKNYGLKWSSRRSEDFIIARLTRNVNAEQILDWVRKVKEKAPELSDFMDFMLATGLRYTEAIESYNLIIELAKQNRLNEYYNEEKEALEHFRFKDKFIRNSKKAFISFVPKQLVQKIAKNKPLDWSKVRKKIEWRVGKLKFADLREYHATFMTKFLSRAEIDFLHGRVSTNVFMQNYFNPALISDLKERVFKAIREIEAKIS